MQQKDLENLLFEFKRSNGTKIGTLALGANGLIKRYKNYNEKYWKYEDGFLYFLNGKSQVTTKFHQEGDKWIGDFYSGTKMIACLHVLQLSQDKIYRHRLESEIINVCNLSCKNCNHLIPYVQTNTTNFERFKKDMELANKYFVAEEFYIIGGEPLLLGAKLKDYIQVIRELGFVRQIILFTNGLLLPKFDQEILGLVDRVVLAYYKDASTQKLRAKEFRELDTWLFENKGKTKYILNIDIKDFFHPTFRVERNDEASTNKIWTDCCYRVLNQGIRDGYYYLCPPLYCFGRGFKAVGMNVENSNDLINLETISTVAELRNEIRRREQDHCMETCYYCHGTSGVPQARSQVPKASL